MTRRRLWRWEAEAWGLREQCLARPFSARRALLGARTIITAASFSEARAEYRRRFPECVGLSLSIRRLGPAGGDSCR